MSATGWLPEPEPGTAVCGGFDGSENDDWTAIKLETVDGLIFTPRYGPDKRPTVWNPAEWGGRIPRDEVRAAWAELADRFDLRRVYADPGFRDESSWESDIEAWDVDHGPRVFVPWVMAGSARINAVYEALRRFESDLAQGMVWHDGCPITTAHMGNARRLARSGDRYILGKASQSQKIDAAVTTVLAHEAACDERATGWSSQPERTIFFLK